jgi:DeoR family transcriptional regulator of aga operon
MTVNAVTPHPKNAHERQQAIFSLLKVTGTLRVQELAETFSCSLATIRRDIHELVATEPQVRRYHGVIAFASSPDEQRFDDKTSLYPQEKDELAQWVVKWLPQGSVIGLNGGTTTTRVAAHIAQQHKNITVVTNAINIAYQLAQEEVQVVVIGGDLRPFNYETTGTMAIAGLSSLHLDWAILGANGVHPRIGITTTVNDEAVLGQGFRQAADQVLIVADHSKIASHALYRMLDWTDIDYVATGAISDSVMQQWPVTGKPMMNAKQTVGIWKRGGAE